MASIIYPMLLFIFILGAGVAYINNVDGQGNGLYDMKIPESGVVSNLSQASSMNTAMLESSKSSELNYIEMLNIVGSTVAGGLLAIFTLGPLLNSLGIPMPMVVWLISPLGIVLVFWLIEMWLGRSPE